jgi:Flp pilus assembly protein TadD
MMLRSGFLGCIRTFRFRELAALFFCAMGYANRACDFLLARENAALGARKLGLPASPTSYFRRCAIIFLLLFAHTLCAAPNAAVKSPGAQPGAPALTAFMALPQALRDDLDKHVRPVGRNTEKILALHQRLYSPQGFNIRYENTRTKTAEEAFSSRSGNCLSLAALYVSAARYLGLNAQFQAVTVPDEWMQREHTVFFLGHVNVLVKVPGHQARVEFLDTYLQDNTPAKKARPLTDQQALARYYNNLGAEALSEGRLAQAKQHFQMAITQDPDSADAWVNLGVLHKREGQGAEAEKAYQTALRLEPNHLSALSNLQVLYQAQQRLDEAQHMGEELHKRRLKNPYYLAKTAQKALASGEHASAIAMVKKAIAIKADARFYQLLGQAHFAAGHTSQAQKALETSVTLAADAQVRALSMAKLQALQQSTKAL